MKSKWFTAFLSVIIFASNIVLFSENIEHSSLQWILDEENYGESRLILISDIKSEGTDIEISSDIEKRSAIKDFISNLELIIEPSFGYSLCDSTITSFFGVDLGTFREHFGTVPIFGFALKLIHNKCGIKLGYFYQRSNPSYFSLRYDNPEELINYTLEEIYMQIFYQYEIAEKFFINPSIGIVLPKLSSKSIYINYTDPPYTTIDSIYLPKGSGEINFFLSIQIEYEVRHNFRIFLTYSFSGYYKKDNLSFGLSFKLF